MSFRRVWLCIVGNCLISTACFSGFAHAYQTAKTPDSQDTAKPADTSAAKKRLESLGTTAKVTMDGAKLTEIVVQDGSLLTAEDLAELIKNVDSGKINNNQGKEVLIEMFETGKTAEDVIKEKGFEQVSDSGAIEKIVDEVIATNQANVDAYRGGNEKLFGFFVGQVMKASQGKANPKVVNEVLKAKL